MEILSVILLSAPCLAQTDLDFRIEADGTVRHGDLVLGEPAADVRGFPNLGRFEAFVLSKRGDLESGKIRLVFKVEGRTGFERVAMPMKLASQLGARSVRVDAGPLSEVIPLLAPPAAEPAPRLRAVLCARGGLDLHRKGRRLHLDDPLAGAALVFVEGLEAVVLKGDGADAPPALLAKARERLKAAPAEGPVLFDLCEGAATEHVLRARRALAEAAGTAPRLSLPGWGALGLAPPPEPVVGTPLERSAMLGGSAMYAGSAVTGLRFSPDGRRLAVATLRRGLRVWNLAKGVVEVELDHPGGPWPHDVLFGDEGASIGALGKDGIFRAWDLASGKEIRRITFGKAGQGFTARVSLDLKRVAVSEGDARGTRILEADPKGPARELAGIPGDLRPLAFSPDGRLLALGGNRLLSFHEVETGKMTSTARLEDADVGPSAAFSKDGRLLATVCSDSTLRIWEAAAGGLKLRVRLPRDCGDSLEFFPDGTRLATAGNAGGRLVEVGTGRELAAFDGKMPLAISPDAEFIATGGDVAPRRWNAASGRELDSGAHSGSIVALAFPSGGATAATAATDRTVRIWDAATERCLARMEWEASSLAYSPDGARLAGGGWSGGEAAAIWEAATGKKILGLSCHPDHTTTGSVRSIRFSPDGRLLGGRINAGAERVWVAATGLELTPPPSSSILDAAISPDGKTLALADAGDVRPRSGRVPEHPRPAAILLLDREDETEQPALPVGGAAPGVYPEKLAYTPDGRRLLSTDSDAKLRLWDLETRTVRHAWEVGVDARSAISPDGARVGAARFGSGATVWDVVTGKPLLRVDADLSALSPDVAAVALLRISEEKVLEVVVRDVATGLDRLVLQLQEKEGGLRSLAWSGDGKSLVAVFGDGQWRCIDAATGRMVARGVSATAGRVAHPSFDGKLLALVGNKLELLDVATGATLFSEGGASFLEFAADGKALLARSVKGEVLLIDTSRGEVLRKMPASRRVKFSRDGARFLEVVSNFLILEVDSRTGKELRRRRRGGGPPRSVVFLADGRALAASDEPDGVVLVWDVQTRKTLAVVATGIRGDDENLASATLSPDGRMLAVWDLEADTILLWSLREGKAEPPMPAALRGPPGASRSFLRSGAGLAYLDDGRKLVASASPGRSGIHLWDLPGKRRAYGPEGGATALMADGIRPAVSPDGRFLADVFRDEVLLADPFTGKTSFRLRGLPDVAERAYFSGDGVRVAASRGPLVFVWVLP